MMWVEASGSTPDGTFEMFNSRRKKVWAEGWLIGVTGSDGEPLLVNAKKIPAPRPKSKRNLLGGEDF